MPRTRTARQIVHLWGPRCTRLTGLKGPCLWPGWHTSSWLTVSQMQGLQGALRLSGLLSGVQAAADVAQSAFAALAARCA